MHCTVVHTPPAPTFPDQAACCLSLPRTRSPCYLLRVSGSGHCRGCSSTRLAVLQDGPAAGQTIPHVHIHCVPRHFKDLERNDEVYDRIDDAEQRELSARQRCA